MFLNFKLNILIFFIITFFILYYLYQDRGNFGTNLSFRSNITKNNLPLVISEDIIQFLKPYCSCSDNNEFIVVQKKIDSSKSKDSFYVLASLIQLDNKSYQNNTKRLLLEESFEELKLEKVTCDLYNVLKRGKNQRVIAFSLYGTNRIYYERLELLLQQIRLKYKSYTARIYYDKTVNKTLRCYLECKYRDFVDFCNINHFSTSVTDQLGVYEKKNTTVVYEDLSYMHKMMWRFIPVGDSFIDVFMSRDTDSFIIDRELDSVKEWLNSNNIAHMMRGRRNIIFFHNLFLFTINLLLLN